MGIALETAVGLFLTAKRAEGAKDATLTWYGHRLRRFVGQYGGQDVGEIRLDEVRAYMVKMLETDFSGHTKFTLVRVVRTLFKWLYEERRIDDNFYRRIKLPKLPDPPPKAIDMADVRVLLGACGNDPAGCRDRAVMLFLLDTGCRAGGVCGLRVRDLDFEHLRATVFEKGEKGRVVLFTPRTADALAMWMNCRPFPSAEAVFTSMREATPMTQNSVIQMMKRHKRTTGVSGRVNPHAFRHTFAREFLLNGGDLASVSHMMGHTQLAVTKQSYARFLTEELRDKHDRFSPVNHL